MTYTVTELQGLVNTTVKGGLEARILLMDWIEKENVPPVLDVTLRELGVTCKLEFGAAVIVPGPVTVMLTVAVLPPFFLTDNDPALGEIWPPTHVAVGGGI